MTLEERKFSSLQSPDLMLELLYPPMLMASFDLPKIDSMESKTSTCAAYEDYINAVIADGNSLQSGITKTKTIEEDGAAYTNGIPTALIFSDV